MVVKNDKCKKALELIDLAFDGALNEKGRQTLGEHIKFCTDCAREMRLTSLAGTLLTELPVTAAPAGFNEAVIASVRKARTAEKARPPVRWLKWVLSTGAVVACGYTAAAIETVRSSIWSSLTSVPGFIASSAAATAPLLRAGASFLNTLWTLFTTAVNLVGPVCERLALEQSILVATLACVLSLYYVIRRIKGAPVRLPVL
jgi:anti-sigma factor RsiW